MQIPLIDLKAQYRRHRADIDAAVAGVLESAAFVGGPNVRDFEADFAAFLGVAHLVGCANGTDALELVLTAWGVGPGDEVIVPTLSWISTSEVVATAGATPVFVDVHPDTYNLDLDQVAKRITPRTRAIIPVHLFGRPVDMARLMALAEAHGLKVLEDCAQAHGARWQDRLVGTWGHAATFSFFPSKSLGGYGDGGGIATADAALADHLRTLGNHGQRTRHDHRLHGRNSRLDGLQAAVLRAKLPHLPTWLVEKAALADRYRTRLADLPEVVCPTDPDGGTHGWHLFVIRAPQRDALRAHLAERGVQTAVHYPTALPFQPCYADLGHQPADFPVAARYQHEMLTLPFFAELTPEQADYVTDSIRNFY